MVWVAVGVHDSDTAHVEWWKMRIQTGTAANKKLTKTTTRNISDEMEEMLVVDEMENYSSSSSSPVKQYYGLKIFDKGDGELL